MSDWFGIEFEDHHFHTLLKNNTIRSKISNLYSFDDDEFDEQINSIFNEEYNSLFLDLIDIIEELNPGFILFENINYTNCIGVRIINLDPNKSNNQSKQDFIDSLKNFNINISFNQIEWFEAEV